MGRDQAVQVTAVFVVLVTVAMNCLVSAVEIVALVGEIVTRTGAASSAIGTANREITKRINRMPAPEKQSGQFLVGIPSNPGQFPLVTEM